MEKKAGRWKRWAMAAALMAAALLSVWLAAPAVIESQIRKKAERAGATVQIGHVDVGFRKVVLREVRIGSASFPGQKVTIQEVEVRLDVSLDVKAILVRKGLVELSGPWEELRNEYRKWKASRNEGGIASRQRGAGTKIVLEEFVLKWVDVVTGSVLEVGGISVLKNGTLDIRAEKATLKKGRYSLSMEGLKYAGGLDLQADSVDVTKEQAEEPQTEGRRRIGIRELLRKAHAWPEMSMGIRTSRFSMSWNGSTIKTGKLDASFTTFPELNEIEVAFKAEGMHTPIGSYQKLFAILKMKDAERSMHAELEMGAEALVTSHPVLTEGKVGLDHFHFEGKLTAGPDGVEVDDALLEIGDVPIRMNGQYGQRTLSGQASLDSVPCQNLLDSIPSGMAEKLRGMKLKGKLSVNVQLQVDMLDRRDPSVRMGLKNGCKVESVPEALDISRLKKPFKYRGYGRDGKPRKEVTSGPGSANWVPLQLMSRFVPLCIRTMEDPGFWAHNGFHVEAIENSIKENIRTGKFVRGASTLSMQLAKNLWLQRERTASRKLQEAFLTVYLEQELTKERILELYANVVEFGPDVYGIKAAAHHYFRTHPVNLTLGQSLFLASILPRPTSYYFLADGKLIPGRAMRLRRMMKAMKAKGRISEDEYQEGIQEVLVFRHPSTSSTDVQEEVLVTVDGIDPESWGD